MDNLEQILQEDNLGMDPSSLKLLSNDGQDAIYYLAVPGAEAVDRWRALRGLVKETHYWPVLLGTDEDVGFHEDASEDKDHPPTSNIIEDALTIDPVAWLRRDRRAELSFLLDSMAQTMGKEEFASLREQLLDEEEFGDKPPHGEWPDDIQPDNQYMIPYDYRAQQPLHVVYLGFVPTTTSWQVPAFLKFGNWNDCPKPEEHVAVQKRWHDLYGTEIVGMSHDTIELHIARPIQDRATALAIAEEQYLYSPDIVDQGFGTIEALAASFLGGSVWYFWWD